MDTPDYNYSSLSELESLSDSDWLDIASSRGDADSVAGFDDSDREDVDGRPVSRRSFSSIASSRDEVVEGWEGLIEDSSDETPLADTTIGAEMLFRAVANGGDSQDASSTLQPEEDPEDEQVKAALDQSMMSTLSSSRPNSLANSIQTSIVHSTRSLRLSFPDPTTSRLRSLSTSFEDLAPSDADVSASDAVEPVVARAESAADSDNLMTSEVPEDSAQPRDAVPTSPITSKANLHVVLYGSSPVAKFSLVEMLLEKWALSCSVILERKAVSDANTCTHTYEYAAYNGKSGKRTICVVDKTGVDQSHTPFELDGPSIAMIFLPSFSDISVAEHTLYLPVIMSSPLSLVDVLGHTDYLLEAEQQWDSLAVPASKLTSFSQFDSPVVEQDILEDATSHQVGHALRPLFPTSKQVVPKVSAHALTIFAILSMVLGYIVHGQMNAATATPVVTIVANRTISPPLWGLLRPTPVVANKSSPTSVVNVGPSNTSVSMTSLKSLEVAVFSSTPTPTESISTIEQSIPSSSSRSTIAKSHVTPHAPQECECGCGLLTWPGKIDTTDVILRPTSSALTAKMDTVTSLSLLPSHSHAHSYSQRHDKGKGKAKAADADSTLYALSSRIVTSLSEYFDFTPLSTMVQQDIQEILDAIDQLVAAISRQSSTIWEQSKDTVSALQERFKRRNERAKRRAKQMREVGGRWISSVKEHLKSHTESARVNAKALKAHVVNHLEARHKRSKRRSRTAFQQHKQRWTQRKTVRPVRG